MVHSIYVRQKSKWSCFSYDISNRHAVSGLGSRHSGSACVLRVGLGRGGVPGCGSESGAGGRSAVLQTAHGRRAASPSFFLSDLSSVLQESYIIHETLPFATREHVVGVTEQSGVVTRVG